MSFLLAVVPWLVLAGFTIVRLLPLLSDARQLASERQARISAEVTELRETVLSAATEPLRMEVVDREFRDAELNGIAQLDASLVRDLFAGFPAWVSAAVPAVVGQGPGLFGWGQRAVVSDIGARLIGKAEPDEESVVRVVNADEAEMETLKAVSREFRSLLDDLREETPNIDSRLYYALIVQALLAQPNLSRPAREVLSDLRVLAGLPTDETVVVPGTSTGTSTGPVEAG